MRALGIDLETFSDVDIQKSGVYAYTASPRFEILLFAYAYDDNEIRILDLASGEKIPDEVLHDLSDSRITKTAFNAQFERTCLASYLKKPLSPVGWQCTAVLAATLGLPLSLAGVAKVLGLE